MDENEIKDKEEEIAKMDEPEDTVDSEKKVDAEEKVDTVDVIKKKTKKNVTDSSKTEKKAIAKETDVVKKDDNKKEASKKKGHGVAFAVTMSLIAVALSGTSTVFSILSYNKLATPLTIISGGADGNSANFTEGSVADIVSKVAESVVSIVTSIKSNSYFGQSYTSSAAGTGMVVTSDGYVLTNKHVIEGATKINVVLKDGTTYEDVKVVAVDPLNDVAFLKINNASDLKVIKLGDSKTINVGQQVIAIGNALGQYQNSVTSGIISGTGRSLTASDSSGSMSERLNDMIQTDAAINSGNSGGPLVNAAGEVIGINTATSSSAENVGFAIPISSVKGMLSQLTEKGEASRAYIGVYSSEVTADVAKEYNLPVTNGAYVYNSGKYSAIVKDSPAEKAGIKEKDIITAVNGAKVGVAGSLSSLIGEYKPSDTVQLTILRDGKEIAVNVTLGAYKDQS